MFGRRQLPRMVNDKSLSEFGIHDVPMDIRVEIFQNVGGTGNDGDC